MALGVLIILYALADTIKIPTGCFVVTWIWLFFSVLYAAIKIGDGGR